MSSYYFESLAHTFLASHTAQRTAEVGEALSEAGLAQDAIERGVELARRGEALVIKVREHAPDYKTLHHNVHAAVAEVEMWLQTAKLRMKKARFNEASIRVVLGTELHAHEHVVTAIAQALRALGVLRTITPDQSALLGEGRSYADLLARGKSLKKKLYKVADPLVSPSSVMPDDHPIFAEIGAQHAAMDAWLAELDRAGAQVPADRLALVGMTGRLPEGAGQPVGGHAYHVVRHERAQIAPPDAAAAAPTSGWAAGRQGNRENLGAGWLLPETGSVTGD